MAHVETATLFDSMIAELDIFSAERARLGSMRPSDPEYGDGRRHDLDYDDAKQAESDAVGMALESIAKMDDEIISPFHKAIANVVIGRSRTQRPSADAFRSSLRGGFGAFDRIYESMDIGPHLAATAGGNQVTLYHSQGVNDLQVGFQNIPDGKVGIDVIIENGTSVRVESVDHPSFPDFSVDHAATFRYPLAKPAWGSDHLHIAKTMAEWDPACEGSEVRLTRLGTREEPAENPADWLESDEQRFAFRIAAAEAGETWLQGPQPAEAFRTKFATAFGEVFGDILSGIQPRDEIVRSKLVNGLGGRLTNSSSRRREKPLGRYARPELLLVMDAAGVSPADILAATDDEIARIADGDTPNLIAASYDIDSRRHHFFGKLFNLG